MCRHTIDTQFIEEHPAMHHDLRRFQRLAPNIVSHRRSLNITFIGDSTFRNQFLALCLALSWRSLNADNGGQCSGKLGQMQIHASFVPSVDLAPPTRFFEPGHVVYLGAGLWSLFPTPFSDGWDAYERWQQYGENSARVLAAYRLRAVVVVSTTHAVCAPTDGLAPSAEQCSAWLYVKRPLASSAQRDAHCAVGRRNDAGVRHLNAQLLRQAAALNVSVFDAYSKTANRCTYNLPDDNLHFHLFLFRELLALWRVIGRATRSGGADMRLEL